MLKCTTNGEEKKGEGLKATNWQNKISHTVQFYSQSSCRDLPYFKDPRLIKQYSLNMLERLGRMQVKNYTILSGVEMSSLNKTKKFCPKPNFTASSFIVSRLMKDFRNGPQTTG